MIKWKLNFLQRILHSFGSLIGISKDYVRNSSNGVESRYIKELIDCGFGTVPFPWLLEYLISRVP